MFWGMFIWTPLYKRKANDDIASVFPANVIILVDDITCSLFLWLWKSVNIYFKLETMNRIAVFLLFIPCNGNMMEQSLLCNHEKCSYWNRLFCIWGMCVRITRSTLDLEEFWRVEDYFGPHTINGMHFYLTLLWNVFLREINISSVGS